MTNDYSKSKIYTLKMKNDDNLVYVGSTVQTYLSQRLAKHKEDCRLGKSKCLLHQTMRETDLDNWKIELYEDYPCENRKQLNKREGEVIKQMIELNKKILNKNIAGRNMKDYYRDNREAIIKNVRDYQDKNKEKVMEYKRQYYQRYRPFLINYQREYYQLKKEDRQLALQMDL